MLAIKVVRLTRIGVKIVKLPRCIRVGIFQRVWLHTPIAAAFVSVTAREMLQRDDWVVPVFNGQLRLQKTPLNYWLVAGVGKITGSIDEFTARLPSVLLAILSTAAILYFAGQWLGYLSSCVPDHG